MSRTSSRLSAALVVFALLGLSLPASAALDRPVRVPGVVSWFQEWMDTVWSIFVPDSDRSPMKPAIEMDNGSSGGDRGALIDPNGNPGGR